MSGTPQPSNMMKREKMKNEIEKGTRRNEKGKRRRRKITREIEKSKEGILEGFDESGKEGQTQGQTHSTSYQGWENTRALESDGEKGNEKDGKWDRRKRRTMKGEL